MKPISEMKKAEKLAALAECLAILEWKKPMPLGQNIESIMIRKNLIQRQLTK